MLSLFFSLYVLTPWKILSNFVGHDTEVAMMVAAAFGIAAVASMGIRACLIKPGVPLFQMIIRYILTGVDVKFNTLRIRLTGRRSKRNDDCLIWWKSVVYRRTKGLSFVSVF